jgi:hypothetical protein
VMTAYLYVASSLAAPAILLGDIIGLVPLNGTGERVAPRTVAGKDCRGCGGRST